MPLVNWYNKNGGEQMIARLLEVDDSDKSTRMVFCINFFQFEDITAPSKQSDGPILGLMRYGLKHIMITDIEDVSGQFSSGVFNLEHSDDPERPPHGVALVWGDNFPNIWKHKRALLISLLDYLLVEENFEGVRDGYINSITLDVNWTDERAHEPLEG